MPPYLYRAYMEDSSPASIAVHLSNKVSYCWDAEACHLRYAWEGDFVDNAGLWKGKPNAVATVLGQVFFRSKVNHSIRLGDSPANTSVIQYKGYQLRNRYPEFHYTIDGIDVYELIHPTDEGTGLIRTFRLPEVNRPVWFLTDPQDGVVYEIAGTKAGNGPRKIAPAEAREFKVVMMKKESGK